MQRNIKYCDQLSDAASSVPRNIAEGFGRFRPRQNAQYVRVAAGSAQEILDLLIDGRERGCISEQDFPRHLTAARRAIGTIKNYLKYLDNCDPPSESNR